VALASAGKITRLPEKDVLMTSDPLTALSPLDGRYAGKVGALREHFSEFGLIRARLKVEIEWLKALAAEPHFSGNCPFFAVDRGSARCAGRQLQRRAGRRGQGRGAVTNHDVKALEYWIKKNTKGNAEVDQGQRIHPLRLHLGRHQQPVARADVPGRPRTGHAAGARQGHRPAGRTGPRQRRSADDEPHARPAGHADDARQGNGQRRLPPGRARARIAAVELLGKINGAVGNYNAHLIAYPGYDWEGFAKKFVESLGLTFNPYTIQIEPHDALAELFDAFARANSILIDLDRDIWGYISLGFFKQKVKAGEIGSSTMPHKVNPIDFENSEGNLGLANAVLKHLAEKLPISRWQRDLTDSTVLRNMGVGLGYTLLAYDSLLKGLGKLEVNAT
jgi:adenylosuccinate lyase